MILDDGLWAEDVNSRSPLIAMGAETLVAHVRVFVVCRCLNLVLSSSSKTL